MKPDQPIDPLLPLSTMPIDLSAGLLLNQEPKMTTNLIDRIAVTEEVQAIWGTFAQCVATYCLWFRDVKLEDFGTERAEMRDGKIFIFVTVKGEEFGMFLEPHQWKFRIPTSEPSVN